jgi:outer membrane lipoprotein SlyB
MTTLSQEELDGIYAFAVDLGKRAGQMLTDAAQIRIDGGNATAEQKEHVQKENAVDLVTETDEGKVTIKLRLLLHRINNKPLQTCDRPEEYANSADE